MRCLSLTILLMLSGCDAEGSSMVARQTYADAVTSCDTRFPAVAGGYERRAYCSNAALFARTSSLGGSIDSLEPITEVNLKKSHQGNTGALSPADYINRTQDVVAQARMVDNEEHEERREQNSEVATASLAGMPTSAAAYHPPPPVYMPPPIVTTTCNRFGNQTTCISQ